MWIQNVSRREVAAGTHIPVGEHTVLIQIADPATEFPQPVARFLSVHQLEFLDVEEHQHEFSDFMISDSQAAQIISILKTALENGHNVLVHCVAGMCRSGAIAEVGVMMGFTDTFRDRRPNLLVKKKLMKQLGWTYD